MVIYFLLMILVCLLASQVKPPLCSTVENYIDSKPFKRNSISLFFIFILLGAVAAIRYEVGVDYTNYLRVFDNIKNGYPTHTEIGFNFIVRLIQQVTLNPQFIFAFFSLVTIFFFIVGIYKQSKSVLFSVFLFMSMGFYFYTFNSIRFYLAIALAFYSLSYVINKQYMKFIILIIFAALFHKSALIVLPFYLLAQLKFKTSYIFALNLIGIGLVFFKEKIRSIIFLFYPSYEGSVYDQLQISYYNILTCLIVLALSFLYYKRAIWLNRRNNIYFNLVLFASLIYLYCGWIPEVSRVGYYFTIFNIVFIPNLLFFEENKKYKNLLVTGFVFAYSFFMVIMLAQSYVPTIRLLPYQIFLGKN